MDIRKSLYSKPVIGSIDQGSVFNCAYSVDYSDCEVFGIIITPRCDISNSKVSTLHYLPIVKYSDWIELDLFYIVFDIIYKNTFNETKAKFNKHSISPELLNFATIEDIRRVINALDINQKDSKAITDICEKLYQLKSLEKPNKEQKVALLKENSKLVKGVINEIAEFKRKTFYFLEPWSKDLSEPVFVVLLREIRSISQKYAMDLSEGCYLNGRHIERYDDVRLVSADEEIFASVESLVNPPFMEHLVQTFFYNFGRIGIQDYDTRLDSFLIDLL